MADTAAAAEAYAQRLGWRVFPVREDGRTPMIKGGCHAATADPAEIRRLWAERPGVNLALACGPESGVFVLDVDRHGDQDGFQSLAVLEDEFGQLPQTWRQATPNHGEHLFFRHPAGRELRNRQKLYVERRGGQRDIYPGLDVRTACAWRLSSAPGGAACAGRRRRGTGCGPRGRPGTAAGGPTANSPRPWPR